LFQFQTKKRGGGGVERQSGDSTPLKLKLGPRLGKPQKGKLQSSYRGSVGWSKRPGETPRGG
jgi:hypothetical protein